jgi:hypothetical protein
MHEHNTQTFFFSFLLNIALKAIVGVENSEVGVDSAKARLL